MKQLPKVSVVTICYNQEKYIRQALESIIKQKTNFTIEVVVADDASSDGTSTIIEEYQKSYPNIIKPILRKKNVGAVVNSIDALRHTTGEYVALCEGDDFWTDKKKLQSQVDFLEKHPEYSVCFHKVKVFYEGDKIEDTVFPDVGDKYKFTLKELLEHNYIQTNAVMYRRQDYKNIPTNILPLDWYLHLYHAQFGKIGFINAVMSAYRRHPGGLWWEAHSNIDNIWKKYGTNYVGLYVELLKLFDNKMQYRKIIKDGLLNIMHTLLSVDERYNASTLQQALDTYPQIGEMLARDLYQKNEELKKAIAIKDHHIDNLQSEANGYKQDADRYKQEIKAIRDSKIWRATQKARKIVRLGRK